MPIPWRDIAEDGIQPQHLPLWIYMPDAPALPAQAIILSAFAFNCIHLCIHTAAMVIGLQLHRTWALGYLTKVKLRAFLLTRAIAVMHWLLLNETRRMQRRLEFLQSCLKALRSQSQRLTALPPLRQ